jgi:hypothetical protein
VGAMVLLSRFPRSPTYVGDHAVLPHSPRLCILGLRLNHMKDWVFKGVVPLLAALLGIAFQAQSQVSWGAWLKGATVVAGLIIVGYAMWSLISAAWLGLQARFRDRRIESDFGHEVFAIASRVGEATNRNFSLSAGCILNGLFDAKACDAVVANSWGAHLGTLQMTLLNVATDVNGGSLPVAKGLARLCELHRDYTRLCGSVFDAVRRSDRQELARSWDAISDYANNLSGQLVQITHKIQARRGENLSCYFEAVART